MILGRALFPPPVIFRYSSPPSSLQESGVRKVRGCGYQFQALRAETTGFIVGRGAGVEFFMEKEVNGASCVYMVQNTKFCLEA